MADDRKYFTLLTDKGRFKIAAAAADRTAVKITHLAIGDGGGQETSPLPSQTALVNEVWRAPVEAVEIDPKNPAAVLVAAIIPHDAGGWWMREFGIFDVDNDLLAVVRPVPMYKATDADGQLEDIYYQFQLVIGEQAQVVVVVDPSILWASRDFVNTRRIPMWQMMNTPWLAVRAIDVQTPPASSAPGDTYLVPEGAKDGWAGKTGQLAEWNGEKWTFMQTPDGHGISLPDGRILQRSADQYLPKTDRPPVNYAVYKTPGSSVFVVPAGVRFVFARVWGAGGGGGGSGNTSTAAAGAGGGGGGYAEGWLSVTAGDNIMITVGAGGAGGAAGTGESGEPGEQSSTGSYIACLPGQPGEGHNTNVPSHGGGGGGFSGGSFGVKGAVGQGSSFLNGVAIGGEGGGTYTSTNSHFVSGVSAMGYSGVFPGGGGGGGANGGRGGNGSNGLVILQWS